MLLLAPRMGFAQPENPDFSLSTSVFFEVNMQTIALVDVESIGANSNFTLAVPSPTEAGEGIGSNPLATNSDNWLNYSNAVPLITSRDIEININSGTMPPNFELRLDVAAASGSGGGFLGTAAGSTIVLSGTPQNIVTDIRGAFTGDGPNNGHQLTFYLHHNGTNYDQIDADQDVTIELLYTIVDN